MGIRGQTQTFPVEIVSGLAEGEEYVVMGQNKLTDGAHIERVKDAEPAP